MSSLVIAGDTSGSVTLQAPAVSGSTVLTLPATSGTVITTASGTASSATTATNLAGGVAGAIPYQSGSGATGFSAAGTAGQVLTSAGTSAPTWSTPAAGALTLLSTVTASNSATMDIETTFSSTYDKYLISVTGLVCQTDGQQLRMLLKIGGTYLTTATYVTFENRTQSSANTFAGVNESIAGPTTFVSVHSILGNASGENASFDLYISNPASTTLQKLYYFLGAGNTNAGEVRYIQGIGCNTGTAALTGVRFQMASGNITSGVARLYGFSNS
jgi:hypothetical protein